MFRSFRAGSRAVLALSLWLAPSALSAQGSRECVAGLLQDSLKPSREGFFREALFAAASARTPRFDDYTPGSYHVDKIDLAEGLPAFAKDCGLALDGLVVVGPVGPLWAYHVIVFMRDRDSVRLNSLVMPHARITGKGTGTITEQEFAEFFQNVSATTGLKPGRPVWSDTTKSSLDRDFSYDFLAVRFTTGAAGVWWGSITRESGPSVASKLIEGLNKLLGRTQQTYPRGS